MNHHSSKPLQPLSFDQLSFVWSYSTKIKLQIMASTWCLHCPTATDSEQVHAEASTFISGQPKAEVYAQVLDQAKSLFDGQRNWVS